MGNQLPLKVLIAIFLIAPLSGAIWFLHSIKLNQPFYEEKEKNNIAPKDYVQLLFVGDLMFDRGIRYYAQKNDGNEFIFDKISPMLLENDLVVANLEGPITDNKSVSSGTTPGSTDNYFFTFDPSLAKTLFQKNIRLVNLGNNHILNFGRAGLASTKEYLDQANVSYFGAPDPANADTPTKSASTQLGGIKITFINYNEFSILPEGTEEKATIEEIQKAREYSDIIIIFCHWGVEYAKTPTDSQKDLAHQFIDAGADLIIGSHSHVTGPVEGYKGNKIYYSLGNFIFDQYFNKDVRNGLGVGVKINKQTKQMNFSEKHFYLDSNGQTIMLDEK